MTSLQWKEFFRCVLKTKSRFISMLLITALGVAFYVGIRASGPDMELSADTLYDRTNLMDIRVLGTLGMTEDDAEAIRSIEGISAAQGAYSFEAIYPSETSNTEYVATVFSLCDEINQMTVEEGRLPQTADECFMDSWFMRNAGLEIGDSITLTSGTDTPISDTLSQDTFTIVGSGTWSWYLSWERGTTSIGNGNISFFVGILPDAFSMDAYTVVYATVDSADMLNSYSSDYEDAIAEVAARIESIAGRRCEIRYSDVTKDAYRKINDAQLEIDDAQQEIDDAWAELEDARLQLEDAEKELQDGESELLTNQQDIKDAELEIADGLRELAAGRKALIEGEAELNAQIALFNESKTELESGQRELNEQKSALSAKQTEVLSQKAELEKQQKELADQKPLLEQQKASLEKQRTELLPQKQGLESKKKEVEGPLNELKTQRAALVSQKDSIEQAISLYEQRDSLTATREELAGQIDQVDRSLSALKVARAVYDSQMPELYKREEAFKQEQAGLDAKQTEINQEISAINAREAAVQTARTALSSLTPDQWTTVSGYRSMLNQISAQSSDLAGQTVKKVLESVQSAVDSSLSEGEELTDEHLASVVPNAVSSAISEADRELDRQESLIAADRAAITLRQAALDTDRSLLTGRQQALDEILVPLKEAVSVFNEKEAELTGYHDALTAGIAEIDAGLVQINAAINSIGMTYDELVEARGALTDGIAQIDASLPALESAYNQITDGLAQLNSGLSQLDAGLSEINAYLKQIDDGQKQIAEGLTQIEGGLLQMADAEKQLKAAQAVIDDGHEQLEAGEIEIREARQLLYDNQKELAEGERTLNDARRQLKDGKQQLSDGGKQLSDGRKEYEEGLAKYNDGLKEYNEAVAEAQPELDDARKQLDDARKQLEDISVPEWFVLDRNSIQTFVEYGMDAERINAIGDVFPIIFFLVAALVCLTGMTRMVEEERIQIGTFKALGYSNGMIASKYFLYAFTASIVGSVIGILVGSSLLPFVIMNAYGMLYSTLTELFTPLHWMLSVSAILIAVGCIVGAAMAACYKTLHETPANLMRPTSPPKGKRVFLEYIRPLWRHMSFAQKAAARNLFRYKKRLFMTIFGIAGCMALLIVGFGLRDSIQKIVDTQYSTIWTYNVGVSADSDRLGTIREHIMQNESAVNESIALHQSALDTEGNNRTVEAYLFVPETTVGLNQFVHFQDRITHETHELSDSGVIITEKLAKLLHLNTGDLITLCRSETERFSVRVLEVSENYLYHYIYMTPALYAQVFNEEPEFSQLFLKTEALTDEEYLDLSERLLMISGVKSVSLVSSLQSSVANMMNAMNLVIWVLIIAAGLLAFIVLFNLNNISILERRRELATLRVLGFYDGELAAYLYRENVVLTILGIAAGVVLGVPLHQFIIGTLELDMIMFGRVIQPMSYLASIIMTLFFAGAVNFGMFFSLRKIDMVESLKSVE